MRAREGPARLGNEAWQRGVQPLTSRGRGTRSIEERHVATGARRRSGSGRPAPDRQRRRSGRSEDGPIPVLEKAARTVESAVHRSRVTSGTRVTFQAVALLVRELRERVKADDL